MLAAIIGAPLRDVADSSVTQFAGKALEETLAREQKGRKPPSSQPCSPGGGGRMRYVVRCHHCSGNGTPLMLVDTLGPSEDADLRQHLETTHPHVGSPQTVGDLLKHFAVSPVEADP